MKLFNAYDLANLQLRNRIVMAPMTRARNPDNIADDLTALYYEQRASAGLIVTEGIYVSQEAQGSLFVPSIWSQEQAAGWAKVTDAVHGAGGNIFAQLWHVGRMSHSTNQPDGGQPLSSSAIPVAEGPGNTAFAYLEDGTPSMVAPTPPRAMTEADIERTVLNFADAAERAVEAGFDGIEVHGATGYIFEQFLNPNVNRRTDRYGGSIEARTRFVFEVVDAIIDRIGPDRTGIRLSPRSMIFDMASYDESDDTYRYLAAELGKRGVVYLHFHDVGPLFGAGFLIPDDLLRDLKSRFGGTIIHAGAMTKDRAHDLIERGLIDLAAFGQPYIANPDLPERLRHDIPLAIPDRDTYYGGRAHGYTDYPVATQSFDRLGTKLLME